MHADKEKADALKEVHQPSSNFLIYFKKDYIS